MSSIQHKNDALDHCLGRRAATKSDRGPIGLALENVEDHEQFKARHKSQYPDQQQSGAELFD